MPWSIVVHDKPVPWEQRKIGDAWWVDLDDPNNPWHVDVGREHVGLRRVLFVTLPGHENGYPFCVHSAASRGDSGWDVTGTAPKITVSPSIHIVGSYHGWIRDGVITDDCDGRVFRDDGSPVPR